MVNAKVWNATELHQARPQEWLANGWLPRSAITLLVGDEGIGKSLYWVRVVAAVTSGKPMHECGIPARKPEVVTLVITEDDWSTTVLPRLVVAGADLKMIRVICAEPDGSGAPQFPDDMHLIYQTGAKLVVVDALMDTVASLGGNARKILHPWSELAAKTRASVLLLTHTNRTNTGRARDRYGSSSELRKKARMTLFAQKDHDGYLTVGPEKTNIAKPANAVRFSVTPVKHFTPSYDNDGTVGMLSFVSAADQTAAEMITDNHSDEHQERTEAVMWLKGYLQVNGTVLSATAKAAAKRVGISTRTLQRARQQLKVDIGYVGQPPLSTWTLA